MTSDETDVPSRISCLLVVVVPGLQEDDKPVEIKGFLEAALVKAGHRRFWFSDIVRCRLGGGH